MKEGGFAPIPKNSNWLLLGRAENLNAEHDTKLAKLLKYKYDARKDRTNKKNHATDASAQVAHNELI